MNPYTRLPSVPLVHGRESIVLKICTGKHVLHVGCVDAGLLEERFAQNQLMHQKLQRVTTSLWGLDVDVEGIEFLRQQGFDHLIVADASTLDEVEQLKNCYFDVIVVSEVVEHLENPGLFFQSVKKLMRPGETELIITVPNAFRIETLLWLLQGVEYNHPDHNYWFSYVTISNLVRKNGLSIKEFAVYTFQSGLPQWRKLGQSYKQRNEGSLAKSTQVNTPSLPTSFLGSVWRFIKLLPKRALISFLYRQSPFWGDGLIVVAQLENHG